MRKVAAIVAGFGLLGFGVSARPQTQQARPDDSAVVKQYCVACHNDRGKSGGLSLAAFDVAHAEAQAEIAERMIRKLRAGMMPPPGARRPEAAVLQELAQTLETRVDRAAAAKPNAGSRPFQRLNRAEYARAVKAILAIDIDPEAFLPADTISQSFDNIADAQSFSPTLMEGYLRAASSVAALAVGDVDAPAGEAHYRVPKTASQLARVEGAPLGTRGGISVVHTFPADGDYVFRIDLHGNADGFLFGGPAAGEQIEVSINGERKALLDIDPRMAEVTTSLTLRTPAIHVAAGAQRVTAAFLQRFEGPVNDLIAPIDHTLADTQIGVAYGVTTLPHLKDLSIAGPQRVTGVSDTASRRRIFTCRPTAPAEEQACARRDCQRACGEGVPAAAVGTRDSASARVLRRRPQVARLRNRRQGGARGDSGEPAVSVPPRNHRRGAVGRAAANGSASIDDVALASRLSFFLWAAPPDADLQALAQQGRLHAPRRAGRSR